jgi:hypothetical protein
MEGSKCHLAVNAADDPRSGNQEDLNAAPTGIDARWAWSIADGAGVRFVDLERGWTLDHKDLAAAGITYRSKWSRRCSTPSGTPLTTSQCWLTAAISFSPTSRRRSGP